MFGWPLSIKKRQDSKKGRRLLAGLLDKMNSKS